MTERIIISSDHVDKHGDIMTKEALESGAKIINGDRCVKLSIDHKREVPPIGKIADAEVIEKDGHFYLTARQIYFDKYEEISWNSNLVRASCSSNNKPFNEPKSKISEKLIVSTDPHIFKTLEDFENYQTILKGLDSDIETEQYGRKALINDPEIILRLAEYYFIYKLLKPTVEKTIQKTTEKISDKLSDEAVRFYDFIRKSMSELASRIKPTNRPISYVIQVPGSPEIELFARIKESEDLIKALKPRKVEKIKNEMARFSDNFQIEKAQFVLEDGKWKFNYLLTTNGEAIGTKKSFQKRDKKLEYVNEKTKEKRKN